MTISERIKTSQELEVGTVPHVAGLHENDRRVGSCQSAKVVPHRETTGHTSCRALSRCRLADICLQRGEFDAELPGYRSRLFADTVESVGIRHIYTRSYRPQTNGKVERYQQTLTTEWAAARLWTTNQQREDDLDRWLHYYNHHRYHSAVKGAPITRVNNLREHYT